MVHLQRWRFPDYYQVCSFGGRPLKHLEMDFSRNVILSSTTLDHKLRRSPPWKHAPAHVSFCWAMLSTFLRQASRRWEIFWPVFAGQTIHNPAAGCSQVAWFPIAFSIVIHNLNQCMTVNERSQISSGSGKGAWTSETRCKRGLWKEFVLRSSQMAESFSAVCLK